MTTAFALLTLITLAVTAAKVKEEYKKYTVFLGDGPLTPLLAYSAPVPNSAYRTNEPRIVNNAQMPLMLCGAFIVSDNQLLTSIRCSPSIASKASVYIFPSGLTDYLSHLDDAKVLHGAVETLDFKREYNSTWGVKFANVVLVKLNKKYFGSPQQTSTTTLSTAHVTETPPNALLPAQIALKPSEPEFHEENYDIHDSDYEVFYYYDSVEANSNESGVLTGNHVEGTEDLLPVDILDLTSVIIDVATIAGQTEQANQLTPGQHNNAVEKDKRSTDGHNNEAISTTPLCTLRELFEEELMAVTKS